MSPITKLAAARALTGAGLGLVGSSLENATLLHDANPNLQHTNLLLGALTGAGAPAKGLAKYLAKTWIPKQFLTFGLNTADKYTREQLPIAEKNLHTAQLAEETAKIQADAAKHLSTSDIARLGLAGAGLAGAGGLGYYLYNSMGPGKKKPAPRVTVTLPTKEKGDAETQISGDMDTLDLSKELYQRMRRDTRRRLRDETNARTHHEPKLQKRHEEANGEAPEAEQPEPLHGIVRQRPEESTMGNIMNLLRN